MNDQSPFELTVHQTAVKDASPSYRRRIIAGLVVSLIMLAAIGAFWVTWQASYRNDTTALELPPPTPPPPVEPLELKQVAPEEARAINAAVPFVKANLPTAKPFRLTGNQLNFDRALDCLASGIYYEAGAEKPEGQRAVAQVIINRVRHPAFPKTVCGVVYQGSTRTTGCQFSFSCDGSMRRIPSPAAWASMRKLAKAALTGSVYKPVGLATHYHTDWVVPYWSSSLDKIQQEATHLFYRWTGWWGTPPAFRGRYGGNEPQVTKLSSLSPAHATTLTGEVAIDAGGPPVDNTTVTAISMGKPVYTNPAGDFMIFLVDRKSDAGLLASNALSACTGSPYCKVMMWTDRASVPTALPISDAQLSKLAFSYLRNTNNGYEKALWNCDMFKRNDSAQCMKSRAPLAGAVAPEPVIIKDRTAQIAPWLNKPPSGLTPAEVDGEDSATPPKKPIVAPPVDRTAPRRRPGSGVSGE